VHRSDFSKGGFSSGKVEKFISLRSDHHCITLAERATDLFPLYLCTRVLRMVKIINGVLYVNRCHFELWHIAL